jgi:hypothetical protein
MTQAEIDAINEQLRYRDNVDVQELAKILMKYGFLIVRSGMPKQDYWS